MEKNPQVFEDIAKKIEQKQKEGKDQMSAAMEVMRENQDELRKLMQ
jgi:signal transduction histidine kinase